MKKYLNMFILLLINTPVLVLADAGLESNYEQSPSIVGAIISAVFQCSSTLIALLSTQPGSKDYPECHLVIVSICLLILFIVSIVYIFKLDKKKERKGIVKFLFSLIPTILFAAFCFLTKLQLILYILALIIYIIVFVIVVKNKLKKIFDLELANYKKLDKKFNEEDFNKNAFNTYKELQDAWSSFKLNKVKDLINEDLYNKYDKKLDELKNDKQKNVVGNIELKSSKITDLIILDDKVKITCELEVTCNDYIINDKDEVVKGKKDKIYHYKNKLVFIKNINDNKFILDNKKLTNISFK